jgi:hypothetical protein
VAGWIVATVQNRRQPGKTAGIADDSAVELLRDIEDERGKLFSEAEYQDMRRLVLDELAHGARCRPFTWFTFSVVILGLAGLVVVGLVMARGNSLPDFALPIVSAGALSVSIYFLWNYLRGLKEDAFRSLDHRLAELQQLRELGLVSSEEYASIEAHILISRQESRVENRQN